MVMVLSFVIAESVISGLKERDRVGRVSLNPVQSPKMIFHGSRLDRSLFFFLPLFDPRPWTRRRPCRSVECVTEVQRVVCSM
jgi:hypothetical protein